MKGQYRSIEEVLSVAQRLTGKSLRDIVPNNVEVTPGNKGAFGLLLEEHGFGVANNNSQAPDFQPVGVELKVVPLKNKGRSWDVKKGPKSAASITTALSKKIGSQVIAKINWTTSFSCSIGTTISDGLQGRGTPPLPVKRQTGSAVVEKIGS